MFVFYEHVYSAKTADRTDRKTEKSSLHLQTTG